MAKLTSISSHTTTATAEKPSSRLWLWKDKAAAAWELLKIRLSMLVAISAIFGYAMAAGDAISVWKALLIGLGGLMTTGAANGLNQVFEKEYDRQMKRTAQRPLPTGRLTDQEAVAFSLLIGILGVILIGQVFNLPAALLSIIGFLSYAFVYTPMKRISPVSVFIGAIPGGLPPLIGWVAYTGALDTGGLILFTFQFFWQFPHFWAIAWRLDDDYQRAGFKMLPSAKGRSAFSATLIMLYTLSMIPLPYFAWKAGLVGWIGAVGLAVLGALFAWPSVQLYRSLEMKPATRLMFFSFLYLPLMMVVFLLG